jgi:hypothetical protein
MKKNKIICLLFIAFCFLSTSSLAQETTGKDTVLEAKTTVIKDPRIDVLGHKQHEVNTKASEPNLGARAAKGYRLMVLSSNDRDLAMKVRAQLLQRFPEQKVYMAYLAPYIKLKFGNFVEKGDADRYKKMIKQAGIVSTNVYLVPEIVEVKPDKDKDKEKEKDSNK